jgi:tripartite-type tricarboxylate transporter receptor subunit TctC
MINRRGLLGLAGATLAYRPSLFTANAQGRFPDRSIRIVVPRSPGGSVDVIGRGWSERVRNTLGQSFIENVGGGGGRIGATAVARAPADGYTLLIGSSSELVLNPLLERQPYDPIKDFAPIGILSTSPLIIGVNPDIPVKNLKDLIAYAKANPGKVNYGTAGAGTIGHVATELFKQNAGLPDVVHVPYKGGAAAVQDAIGGQVTFATVSISGAVVDLHQAGKIRIIAVTSQDRPEASPDLPSIAEQGFPELVTIFFIGLFAPTGVPEPILSQLEKVTGEAMKDTALRKTLLNAGFDVPDSSRAKAARFVQDEFERWGPVLKSAGLARQ